MRKILAQTERALSPREDSEVNGWTRLAFFDYVSYLTHSPYTQNKIKKEISCETHIKTRRELCCSIL
jgi:hypothetical protein